LIIEGEAESVLKKKIKSLIYRLLEKAANRIHPTNSSGNNQSKM
jgi:hypothetical protein